MPRFKIKHVQAVWEETTVWYEGDEDEVELLDPNSPAYDPGYVERVLLDAPRDSLTIEVTGSISGMDDELTVVRED